MRLTSTVTAYIQAASGEFNLISFSFKVFIKDCKVR